MGQCLSCCCDDDQRRRQRHRPSTPNGHGPQPVTAVTVPSAHIHTSIAAPTRSQPPSTALTPPPGMLTTSRSSSSSSSNSHTNKLLVATKLLPPATEEVGQGEVSDRRIHALFDEYRDPDSTDEMLVDGIEKFCEDLQVRPEDFRILVLAWRFNAEQMCLFSRSEFVEGCKKLKVDSIVGLRASLPELVKQVHSNKDDFKQLYRWTYKFGLESGQRTLPTEVASVLWKLVFWQQEPPLLQRWLDFLAAHPIRGIPRDTWDMLLVLLTDLKDDLSAYDDTEAWPSLFDDFVEYENDRHNQNIPCVAKDGKCSGDSSESR